MVEHWFLHNGNKLKKVLIWMILILNVSVVASMCITKYVSGKATVFGYRPYFIMSGSMEPTIKTYQLVLAVPVDASDVQVGDIITYDRYSTVSKLIKQTVIHRVISIDDKEVICKGDNNACADRPININQIGYKIIAY